MTATAQYSAVIHVKAERDPDDCWTLTSNDLPGLLLRGKHCDKLFASAPAVIAKLFELNFGMKVKVIPALSPEVLSHTADRASSKIDAFTALPLPLAA